ncbi:MAG: COX15/CtaA family protein [Verrucomicrobiota bacterium JB023]|nr:COX15/CtaA family protein [Verrucomicrobiota bacterium JB023]
MAERWYGRMVTGVLVFVVLLVFVGAIVRATGAGLGCPDWPTCWGELIPPWKVEQIDPEKLNYERFEKKAERLGRDPATVTPEHILESFNPVHTWTEFVNRLVSLPVGGFSLAAVVFSFFLPRGKRRLHVSLSLLSLGIILFNAWMGAMVVYSGLKPGIITLHLALAMGLLCLLVFCRWHIRGCARKPVSSKLAWSVWGLLFLVIIEGIVGSQVREMTDELARSHVGEQREQWIGELEGSAIYLFHRSFSWLIVLGTALAVWRAWQEQVVDWRVRVLASLVFAMMVMGIILAHVGVFPWVQVLHVGVAAIMVVLLCGWGLELGKGMRGQRA